MDEYFEFAYLKNNKILFLFYKENKGYITLGNNNGDFPRI